MSQANENQDADSYSKVTSIRYFVPARTIEEANSILPKVSQLVDSHVSLLGPWMREGSSLQNASDSLWDLARIAAVKAGIANTWDSAWDHAWREASRLARNNYGWYGTGFPSGETARDAARDAAKYAARYVAYESARDAMKSPNPFSPIVDLYLLGLKPTYFRRMADQERFVVDIPIKMGGKDVLGCYVQGDVEILFAHQWKDYCSNLAPLRGDGSRTLA